MNYLDSNEFFKRKRRIKIIIIYLFVFVYIVYIKYFTIQKDLRVCLCSPTKKENRYLKEFVEHYKGYNLDKIYLYDNNDIEGEHLEDVIEDYIKSGFVEIVNFRGKIRALYDMMNDCYKNHYFNYDWLIFYEIDEYIHLHNYKDIKKFLNKDIFNKCVTIQLNWLFHTDNDKIYYENKPLKIRFPNSNKKVKFPAVKSILKGKIPYIKINCVHRLNSNLKACDGFGNRTHIKGIVSEIVDYKYNYIDHYFCKSTEEFIDKINKGDVLYQKDNFKERIKVYFDINKATKQKLDFINQHLFTNISFNDILF